ncbi:hypothetical protein [Olleya namhaensis]|uniref:Uncharacterized protein n=1 Tax=Olleya namhaensis TaxID=1144750 RepID=A0A1I3R7H3_9FLAO|nr:hypothetical protein [Olleya namhaensis]SFJ41176.1 hypothetical protein SAMN05443431_107111 [Olleya namhaensis]
MKDQTNHIEKMKMESNNTNRTLKDIAGSGYEYLRGSVINYKYEEFGGFHISIYNNRLKFLGTNGGYFCDIAREVIPQFSEIADGIIFMSWSTGGNGGDNVVQNYNTKTVNGHLNPDTSEENYVMQNVHGVISNKDNEASKFPHALLTVDEDLGKIILKNINDQKLPELYEPELNNKLRFSEDKIARNELSNQRISYESLYGTFNIEIDGNNIDVSINDEASKKYQIYCSKIDNGIYFISWESNFGGNHIVVNKNTMKVFQHIHPSGKREEAIYDITFFNLK